MDTRLSCHHFEYRPNNLLGTIPLNLKQEAYLELLFWILPEIRNVQTWRPLKRMLKGNCYPEAELVHNIPDILRESNVVSDRDVWWLNIQAKNYLVLPNSKFSIQVSRQANRLVDLLPPDLKSRIDPELLELLSTAR